MLLRRTLRDAEYECTLTPFIYITALKCLTLHIFRWYENIIASNHVFLMPLSQSGVEELSSSKAYMALERLHEGKPTHYCFHNRNRMLNVGYYGTYKDRSDESINMSFKVRLRDCRILIDVKTAVVSAKQGWKSNINLEDKGKQCPHTHTHKPLQLYFLQVHS